ncbi:hypothetical protein [Paenibacillus campi]|uniref:hypothetical protein n=1 Tax=Paenibacillus campi TaxID=3106031 RepID=UPI002AFE8F7D|nr:MULTISPECIES: hypothetical protein [unclassified Paenibacillus]
MLDIVRFLFFSSVEYYALFFLMLSIFRLKILDQGWMPAFIFLIMSVVSYLLRSELHLYYIVPTLGIIVYLLILVTITRLPFIWAIVVSIVGTGIYMFLQAIIIMALFGNFSSDMQYSSTGSLIQVITSITAVGIAYTLSFFKIGFIAYFEKLRFKFELFFILAIILISMIVVCVLMYQNNLLHIGLFFILLAGIFFYYSLRNERKAFRKSS